MGMGAMTVNELKFDWYQFPSMSNCNMANVTHAIITITLIKFEF